MEQGRMILIGAGNVARHLAVALLKAGGNLCQVYSRGVESARELGRMTGAACTTEPREVIPDGDVYLFCVSDDAVVPVLESLELKGDPLLLHVSGSLPAGVFKPYSRAYGVIYPLQTFSRTRELDFREIPLFIEGNSPGTLERVMAIARELSDSPRVTCLEQRERLHLAAVFACNFPNMLYRVAGKLLEGSDVPFAALRPLILETAGKVMSLSPGEAQTGPAKRGDKKTIARHESLLKGVDEELLTLYSLLSGMIGREECRE